MGSKSTKQTIAHAYYLGMHHVIAHDSVTALRKIFVGETEVWSGNVTANTTVNIDKWNCFGGFHSEGGVAGNVDVCFGRSTQTQNNYLVARTGEDTPAYRGVFATVLKQPYIGTSPYIKYWAYQCEAYHNNWYPAKVAIGTDHNPAHIIMEVLTNKEFGLGYSQSDIDLTAFTAAADTLYTEGFGLSFIWNAEQDVNEFLQEIIRHISGAIYISPYTGLWTLKLIRDDYDVNDLMTFDESNIIEVISYDRPAIGETVNEVILAYTDLDNNDMKNVKVHDSALLAKQGYSVTSTVEFPAITSRTLANTIAQRQLTQLSAPLCRVELRVNRDAYSLGIGDVFLWSWERFGVVEMVLRVLEISYGSADDKSIVLTCVQDVFSIANTVYAPPPLTEWTTPVNEPTDVSVYKLEEFPYLYLVYEYGAGADVTDAGAAQIGTYVRKGTDDSLYYKIMSKLNTVSGYDSNGTAYYNPTCQLAADITETTTAITFTNQDTMDFVAVGQFFIIEDEWCQISAIDIDAGTATIVRGCLDTRPRAHLRDVYMFVTDYGTADGESFLRSSPETVNFKFLPATGIGILDIADATAHNYTTNSRVKRPYTVGRVTIENSYYPTSVILFDAGITVRWQARGRVSQADSIIADSANSSYTIEAGTTLNIYFYNADTNALIKTVTGVAAGAGSYTWTKYDYLNDINGIITRHIRVEIEATLAGLTSWQRNVVTFTVRFPSLEDAYSLEVENRTPSAYYPMVGYGLVTMLDMSHNNNDGVFYGTPIYDHAILVPGLNDPGIKFSGNDGAHVLNRVVDTASSFSVAFWLKLDAVNTGTEQVLVAQHDRVNGEYAFRMYESGGYLYVDKSAPAGLMGITWPALSSSTLYFITYTESAANGGRLYVNGTLIDSDTRKVYTGDTPTRLSIGYDSTNNSKYITGQIGGVVIDNAEWTGANITALYNAGVTAPNQLDTEILTYTPVMMFKLDETSGTVADDASASAYDGEYISSVELAQEGPSPYVANQKSVRINANTEYVRVINNAAGGHPLTAIGDATSEYTIGFWFKTTDSSVAVAWHPGTPIVELRQSTATNTKVPFSVGLQSGKLCLGKSANYTTSDEVSDGVQLVNDGYWHFGIARISEVDDYVEFFIDGAVYQKYTYTVAIGDLSVGAAAARMFIGGQPTDAGTSGNNINGNIGEIFIIDSLLTDAEIQDFFTWAKIGPTFEYNFLPAMSSGSVTFNPAKTTVTSSGGLTHKRAICYIPLVKHGRYVFETTFQGNAVQAYSGISWYKEADANAQYVGERDEDYIFRFDGHFVNAAAAISYATQVGAGSPGDIYQLIYDFADGTDYGKMFCRKNNKVPILLSATIPIENTPYYVVGSVYDNEEVTVNFGGSAFVNDIPHRFSSIDGGTRSDYYHNPNKVTVANNKPSTLDLYLNDTVIVPNTAAGNKSAYSNTGKSSGRYAFEFRSSVSSSGVHVGISQNRTTGNYVGQGTNDYSVRLDGYVFNAAGSIANISAVPANEWIMVCVDFGVNEVSFISPTLGKLDFTIPAGTYYAGCGISGVTGITGEINFGDTPFSNTMIDDCYSWDGLQYQADVNPEIDLTDAITEANLYSPYALYGMNTTPSGTTVPDVSGNGRDGTLTGGMTMGVLVEEIKCAVFDGTNDYITLPTGFANFTSGMTLFALVRPTNNANNAKWIDLAENTTWPNDNIRFGRNNTATTLIGNIYSGATSVNSQSGGTIVESDWHFYALRQDNTGKLYLYVDGVEVASNTDTDFAANVSRASNWIGRSHNNSDSYFKGQMAFVGIYNSDIGATAIADIFAAIGI